MIKDFKNIFCPFDMKVKAHCHLEALCQNLHNPTNRFWNYVSNFQLNQAGLTDTITIINNFTRALDPTLINIILSMKDVPTNLNKWIK